MAVAVGAGLEIGQIYAWEDLAPKFGFEPGYFAVAGGMVSSRATGALLLITHPGGAKSFDYRDHWDGTDLIYTGRGKIGPQQRTGANLDVAENRRPLLVFEAAGPRRLLYLGQARCTEERSGRALGDDGAMRNVLLFRLRFHDGPRRSRVLPGDRETRWSEPQRRPRPFQKERPLVAPAEPGEPARPEDTSAKREQANESHHALLSSLHDHLVALGCSAAEELPGAIDLRATRTDGRRVIFEAKTLTDVNELTQTRSAFAQLHEYRVEHGDPGDAVCLVVDRPLTMRRQRLLDALGVAVLVVTDTNVASGNDLGTEMIDALTA